MKTTRNAIQFRYKPCKHIRIIPSMTHKADRAGQRGSQGILVSCCTMGRQPHYLVTSKRIKRIKTLINTTDGLYQTKHKTRKDVSYGVNGSTSIIVQIRFVSTFQCWCKNVRSQIQLQWLSPRKTTVLVKEYSQYIPVRSTVVGKEVHAYPN